MSYCKEHLNQAERESIARACFQVESKQGNELHGLCPFHQEKKPSFSYNVEKDLCHCLSCGASGDLVTLWGEVHGYQNNDDAFAAFRERFDLVDVASAGSPTRSARRGGGRGAAASNPSTNADEVTQIIDEAEFEKLEPLGGELLDHCRHEFAWAAEEVERLGLRVRTKGQETRVAFPIRRDDGKLVNVRLYQQGSSDFKVISWGKGYGKAKLFPAPSTLRDEVVLLCEGEKDCVTARSQGFNAITQTAGCNTWSDKFTRFFSDRDVVIAYDADEKGAAGAKKVAKKLIKVAKRVRVIAWPEYMGFSPDHGEDLCDFFVKHKRTTQDLKDLIARSEEVERPKEATSSAAPDSVLRFFGDNGRGFKGRLVADEIMRWRRMIVEPKSGLVYSWNDRSWEEYDEGYIRRQVLHLLGIEGSTSRVRDVVGMVRDLACIDHGRAMNDRENMIPLNNGIFSIEEGKVLSHDPNYLNSYHLDIDLFLDGTLPIPKRWQKFLEESVNDPETIRELQKFFGYCLTRETRYEKSLLLIGPGGDGKGTILRVLHSLLGDVNVSNVSMGDLSDQFHRVMLVDKLLNYTTEISSELFQSDMFKAIVSGEPITAAYKHRNAFSFKPCAKLAFSSNSYPDIKDHTDGLYRRMMIIEMSQQFIAKGEDDNQLFEKLMEEKAGIFLWALRGLQLLREEGFKNSEYIESCLETFKQMNNPLFNFMRDCIEDEPDPDAPFVKSVDLYDRYKKYCAKRGHYALTLTKTMIRLQQICPAMKKGRQTIRGNKFSGYKGIKLIDDD